MQNLKLTDIAKFVTGISPKALATTGGDADYVSLRKYPRVTILISVDNATTVTGAAITLKQAKDVAGTGEKALSFDTVLANIDTGASDDFVETAVVSDTFTTDTTNAKNLLYAINIDATMLDRANGFTAVRLDALLMANAIGCVLYALHNSREVGTSAILD